MKILRLESKGFGCLPDGFECSFKPSGLTIIVGNNEAGKSTLVQGILAALYGEPSNPREAKLFRESFNPWQHNLKGPQVVLDVLTTTGKTLTIHRDFGSKTERVWNTLSREDLTGNFQEGRKAFRFGDHHDLMGLSRAAFEKTVLLKQNSLQDFQDTHDLLLAIEKILDAGETGVTAKAAKQKLKEAESQIDPLKGNRILLSNILRNLEKVIECCKTEEAELSREYESYRNEIEVLDEKTETLAQIDKTIQHHEARVTKAEQKEITETLHKQQILQAELADIRTKKENLDIYADFPIDKEHQIKTMYGQIVHVKHTIAQNNEKIVELKKQLSETEHTLSAFPWTLEDVDCNMANDQLQKLDKCHAEFKNAMQELEQELDAMEQSGMDCVRFKNLLAQLEDIPENQLHQLYKYCKEADNIKKQLEDNDNDKQDHKLKQDDLLKQNSLRLRWIILLVVLAITGLISIFTPLSTGMTGGVSSVIFMTGALLMFYKSSMNSGGIKFHQNALDNLNISCATLLEHHKAMMQNIESVKSALMDICPQTASLFRMEELIWFHEKKQNEFNLYVRKWQTLAINETGLADHIFALEKTFKLNNKDEKNILNRYYAILPMIEIFKRFETHWHNWHELKKQINTLDENIDKDLKTLNDLEHTLKDLLILPSIETFSAIEEGMSFYNEGIEKYNELKRLTELYEEKQRYLLPQDEMEQLKNRVIANNELALAEYQNDILSLFEERKLLEDLKNRQNDIKDKIVQLQLSISAKREHFYQHLPEITKEKELRIEQHSKYQRYQEALNIAQQILEEISQNEYGQWSQCINERVNYYLESLNSPYKDVRFTADLQFSFLDNNGREYAQKGLFKNLSCGTRDQIYLATRLAITDYLSQNRDSLPLIMDDPFVNFDDDRFAHAMDALAKVASEERQIIMLSCHANRYLQIFPKLCKAYPDNIFIHEIKQEQFYPVLI